MGQAASGAPERFITLTSNPASGGTPDDRLDALARAWRLIVKRLRRQHPGKEIEYAVVVEATLAGEPHLHILARCPYVPQAQLSAWMQELTNSPIVDIRRISGGRQAAAYVAKYVGKEPHHFGLKKRYWFSQRYQPPYEPPQEAAGADSEPWRLYRGSFLDLAREWFEQGFIGRQDGDDRFVFFPFGEGRLDRLLEVSYGVEV